MIRESRLDKGGALSALIGLVLTGCTGAQTNAPARGSADGTLALSADGALLYVVNPDVPKLAVVDAVNKVLLTSLDVGNNPSRVLVGPGDTVYVANRGSRSVSMFKRAAGNTLTPAAPIATGAEPTGLALSPDGRTLYVACSAQGSVQAFDLGATGKPAALWETQLGNLPRTVAALPDGRIYVGHFLSAQVDVLDPATGATVKSLSTQVGVDPSLTTPGGVRCDGLQCAGVGTSPGNLPAVGISFRPTGLESILVAPDGARAYLFHRRDRNGMIFTDGTPSFSTTPVVTPGITTVELDGDNVLDETLTSRRDFPPAVVFPDNRLNTVTPDGNPGFGGGIPPEGPPIAGTSGGGTGGSYGGGFVVMGVDGSGWTQGPSAAVEDAQGSFLFVANRNTNNVIVLPANRRSGVDAPGGVIHVISVGDGPSGIALSPDNRTLYVHNQIDDSVSVIQGEPPAETIRISTLSGGSALLPGIAEGRRLFFSAANSSMTNTAAGLACESCHLDGSHDGNVWQFTQGPRKTPSLIARQTQATAPYHWDGTESDFHTFILETVGVRMGGSGLSDEQEANLSNYLEQLAPLDNPNLQPGGYTASQQRGKDLFNGQAGCAECHAGTYLTDNSFHDVGTLVTSNPNGAADDTCLLNPAAGPCRELSSDGSFATANPNNVGGFNTPSLLGVVWAAPYLHDGSAATLLDRLRNSNGDKHGKTSQLTPGQLDDLVAYLETL
jgi:DNA-binding beta-propeller fold protein YncE